ncbi:PQQ-binding-like beta-propeller repeat protein, partial [Chryseobacterium gambrini]
VAVADGVAYAGSEAGAVTALSAAGPGAAGAGAPRTVTRAAESAGAAATRWTHDAGDAVRATPTVAGGVVYCGDEQGTLTALDAADGSER